MDMFGFARDALRPNEELLVTQKATRFYNGPDKIKMKDDVGILRLTSHRLIWFNSSMTIALEHKAVIFIEKESASSNKGFSFQKTSPKIVIHVDKSSHSVHSYFPPTANLFLKIGFLEGGSEEFYTRFSKVLSEKLWEEALLPSGAGGKYRAGIVGIERQLAKEARETTKNISAAFQDINSLIEMAKPMVQLSQAIAKKIKDKQGSITDDETIQFRQHLLTRESHQVLTRVLNTTKFGSGHKYFEKLAQEISHLLEKPVNDCGGLMSCVEAYCRINRARGLELLSPEDLMTACTIMEKLNLPLKLSQVGNVKVLQHANFSDELCIVTAISMLEKQPLTSEEYARISQIPVLLAKHSLLLAENAGKACRDESIEGLRFYTNLFLQE